MTFTVDVHCTTKKRHDTQLGWQVARVPVGDLHSLSADKEYDWMKFRGNLCEDDVRPLIKHREFRPIDHVHNARLDEDQYNQRALVESVNSAIKRSIRETVDSRS